MPKQSSLGKASSSLRQTMSDTKRQYFTGMMIKVFIFSKSNSCFGNKEIRPQMTRIFKSEKIAYLKIAHQICFQKQYIMPIMVIAITLYRPYLKATRTYDSYPRMPLKEYIPTRLYP